MLGNLIVILSGMTDFLPDPDALGAAEREALASQLGDSALTTISVHALHSGEGKAYALGTPPKSAAALVYWRETPEEPDGFGDPNGILQLLLARTDWACAVVDEESADLVAQGIEAERGQRTRLLPAPFYELTGPPKGEDRSEVRYLTIEDSPLLTPTAEALGIQNPDEVLRNRIVAGAVVDGRVVAIAQSSAGSDRYADVGIHTLEQWRGRGFATTTARLVAESIQQAGKTPVWSTSAENLPSIRVAEKLGFAKIGERMFVVLE